jgi:outer membrane cobalamin receptor
MWVRAFFLVVWSLPLFLAAQEADPVTLNEIEVWGEGVGLSQKELSPSQVQDVRDRGDLSVPLDHLSGVETQGEGLGKGWGTLAIRGQSFRETVILLNGQRVPESFNLGTLPTSSIQRVEVIEGPQALAFGPDALGGVLNIITRQQGSEPWRLQAGGGDFNTYQFQGSTSDFQVGGIENHLSGAWFTTDGYSPLPPGTDAKGVTYLFTDQVHWELDHQASFDLGAGQATWNTGFFRQIGSAPDADNVIAAGTDQYDLDGRQDAWGLQSLFQLSRDSKDGFQSSTALFGTYSNVLRSNPIGADPTSGVYDPYRNQYLDYGIQETFSNSKGGLISYMGGEFREEDLWSGLFTNHSRNNLGIFLGGGQKITNDISLDYTNWLENHSDQGTWDDPTATLVWAASQDLKFHTSAGKGEKLPDFDQSYLPYTSFAALPPALAAQFAASPFGGVWNGTKGNPDLKPESSIDLEAGVDWEAGEFQLRLEGFLNSYQDLINPVVDPSDNFWTYTNLSQTEFLGTEDSVRWKVNDLFSAESSATYVKATDDQGQDIQGRLRFKFSNGVEVSPEKQWTLATHLRFVDRNPLFAQYLTDLGKPAPPNDYWDWDAEVRFTVSDHLRGFVTVVNLLNEAMASFQGLPLPGRYAEWGIQGSF